MALSLESVEPVDAGCDRSFDVAVTLDDGDQPDSEMRIYREDEAGV